MVNLKELTNEQLIKLYRKTEDEDTKDYFFEKNKKLPFITTNKFTKSGRYKDEHEDIQAEAYKGMVIAFNKFNTSKDTLFTTFAGVVIHREILVYLRKYRQFKKVPVVSMNENVVPGDESSRKIEENLAADNPSFDACLLVSDTLSKFLHNSKEVERTVYRLRVQEDLTIVKTAEIMGVSMQYASKIHGQVMKRLKTIV